MGWAVVCTLFWLAWPGASLVADEASLAARLQSIRADLRSAGKLYREQDYRASAKLVSQAKKQIDELKSEDSVADRLKPLEQSAQKAILALSQAGIQVTSTSDSDDLQSAGPRFSTDIAPLLLGCSRCHGEVTAREGLRILSHSTLLKGSRNGPVVAPGDPGKSLLLSKLKGTADGERMPLGETPLTDQQLATVERWIQQGSKSDIEDIELDLQRVAAKGKTSLLQHDALRREVMQAADEQWALAFPGRTVEQKETRRFLFYATDADASSLWTESADDIFNKVAKLLQLRTPDDIPPIVAFVLPQPYDYAEFIQMVERREPTVATGGHWRNDRGFGYIVIGPPRQRTEPERERQLAMDTASLLVSRLGAPLWFAEGAGEVLANRAYPHRRRQRDRQTQANIVVRQIESATKLIDNELTADDARMANWAFVRFLHSDARRMARLHTNLQRGDSFAGAFRSAYGANPDRVCQSWLDRQQPAKGGKRR